MRIGRRSKFWVKNCISIGLAAGFVEPLGSTGLHTTQRGFELLFEYLPGAAILPQLRDRYNQHMGLVFDQVRDFILLHYYLTRRGEAYWRDARAVPLSASLEEMLALYDEFGQIEPVDGHVFADTSYYLIMDGNRRYPRRPHPRTALAPPMEMDRMLSGLRQQNIAAADTLPPLVDLLDVIHPAKI
ncbi:MAG: tryptophan 7-halogenase [Devosia sp.]|nr:tryptophan 7-halogenase [Devosia sp.]